MDQPQICQNRLPVMPWMEARMARLPGTGPIALRDWLVRDEVFGAQMALRDRLLREVPAQVIGRMPGMESVLAAVLAFVVEQLRGDAGYEVRAGEVVRPDGVAVGLSGDPLVALGRLVQEDVLVHLPGGESFVLAAGTLCFPASWTLAEKLGRDLTRIHGPVARYDADMARRVARMFTGLKPERPLMRANWLTYAAADLFHPRTEGHRRTLDEVNFVRVERQCLVRMPDTAAVVFTVHTYVVPLAAIPEAAMAGLRGEA